MRKIKLPSTAALLLLLCSAAAAGQEAPTPSPTPAPTPAPAEPAPPSPGGAGGPPSPTYFNPSIAVIGNFIGVTGENQFEDRPALEMHESEISLQAVVDPYARADFFVALSNEGVELEEGFVTFLHLPGDFLVKVGKFKAQFGKVNTLHPHMLPWADIPLPIQNLLGSEEGWNDSGVSVARLIPMGDTFSELTAQVFRGEAEGLFESASRNDLAWLAHYRAYRDLGDDHNLELGSSFGRGFNGSSEDARTTLENIHLVYRWKPLQGRPYRSFILRSELFRSRRDQPGGRQTSRGFYVSGDYQLARRWFAGARYEFSDRADDERARDSGQAITLTFRPSEFSQVRGQLRRRRYSGGITANEAFLQVQFAIGAHGAHSF